jgi:thiamine pyrophosphate-dependent acetolactate synthase large subunit-like protein
MLDRAEILQTLAPGSSAIFVAALGNASRELYDRHDRESTFYMLGSMGMPIPFGLGVALGTRRRVIVLEGDGGCLMNLGALATVARYGPANLAIVVLDNESYESTGIQASHTRFSTDLAGIARSSGIENVRTFATDDELSELRAWVDQPGARFALVKVQATERKAPRVQLSPPEIYQRFSSGLKGAGIPA